MWSSPAEIIFVVFVVPNLTKQLKTWTGRGGERGDERATGLNHTREKAFYEQCADFRERKCFREECMCVINTQSEV